MLGLLPPSKRALPVFPRGGGLVPCYPSHKPPCEAETQTDLEPFQMVIQTASSRLLVMDNMQMYLDPIAGPIKLQRDLKPFLESLGVEKNTKFTYDYETDGFQVGFVKDGERFYNPKKDAGKDPK